MGCRAFTPHLVGLAKELENQAFHLVASHNQSGSEEAAKHEIFQNGLDPLTTNVTVSKQARHPGVKGTGYVPYYLVFDQHGDLAYHHQGGPYHGGDGTAVLDRVRGMLKELPVVYVGKEPFERFEKLASELRKGRKLQRSFATLAAALKVTPEDAELARLASAVERHRDRTLARAATRMALDPGAALKELREAAKHFAHTPWSEPLDAAVANYQDRGVSRANEEAAKQLRGILKRLEKLERVAGNGGKVLNPLDARFRSENERGLKQLVESLRELREEFPSSPAAGRAAELLALLESP